MSANRFQFRAWDKEFELMWNSVVLYEKAIVIRDMETIKMLKKQLASIYPDSIGQYCRRLDDVVIMQSTGEVDSTGKEIFEGDVVQHNCQNICNGKYGEIVWAMGGWMLLDNEGAPDMPVFPSSTRFTVAGNIYQNKDLLSIMV